MGILVVFICLFIKFNKLSKDYQAEQKANSSHLMTFSKVLAFFICTLYFMNTILYNIISPLCWYLDW